MLNDLYIALWSPTPLAVVADLAEELGANPSLIAALRKAPDILACDLTQGTEQHLLYASDKDDVGFAVWRIRVWCEKQGCKLTTGVTDSNGTIRGPGYIIV